MVHLSEELKGFFYCQERKERNAILQHSRVTEGDTIYLYLEAIKRGGGSLLERYDL